MASTRPHTLAVNDVGSFFALCNAFFFALHNILAKKGLATSNPTTALSIAGKEKTCFISRGKACPIFSAQTFPSASEWWLSITPLDLGQVVVVIPLSSSTGPLFALTLTATFLLDSERVNAKIITGAG